MAAKNSLILLFIICFIHADFVTCFLSSKQIISHKTLDVHIHLSMDSGRYSFVPGDMEEIPLSQIFQRAMVLQRTGVDRAGALKAYTHFLQVAELHEVEPHLYAEVFANMGALYAMEAKDANAGTRKELRDKAKSSFRKAVEYRPGLGSAWVNLALIIMADRKESVDALAVENVLEKARSCCERALGLDNDDERSRSLANKLIGDIDIMMKQNNAQKPFQ